MMEVVTADGGRLTIGTVETGSTVGIIDYSRRVTDDFGVTTVVQRGFARRLSVRLAVPFDDASALQRRLADLRATSAQWVADARFAWLSPTGFYKDFDIDVAVRPLSFCTLSVEGLAETAPVADPGGDPAPNGRRSTLQLLQPYTVTEAILTASSVAEDDAPAWAAATGYTKGAKVLRQHRVYEALVANSGTDPLAAGGQWLDTGPSKRWAPFDQALGTVAQADGQMTMRLETARIEGVALLDVKAATVRVQADGYDRTQAVTGGAVTFLDLGGKARVTVTIAGAGSVEVGTLLIGSVVALGTTEASPTAGITDFSRKTVDDFGEVTIVKRGFAKRMTAKSLIRTETLDIVGNRIATVRAMPSLWIGQDGLDCLTVYGFFRDFSIEVGPGVSKLSLSIEGLSAADKPAAIVNWEDVGDPKGNKPSDGADVTSQHTAADTKTVAGRPATDVTTAIDANRVAVDKAQADLKAARTSLASDLAAAQTEAARNTGAVQALLTSDLNAVRTALSSDISATQAETAKVRIDLTGAVGGVRADAATAQSQAESAQRAASSVASDLLAEVARAQTEEGALLTKVQTAQGRADSAFSAVTEESLNRAGADSALAGRTSTVEAQLRGDQDSTIAARIRDEAAARAGADSALASRTSSLEATYGGAASGNLAGRSTFKDGSVSGWLSWATPTFGTDTAMPANPGYPAFARFYQRDTLGQMLRRDWGGRRLRVRALLTAVETSQTIGAGFFVFDQGGNVTHFPVGTLSGRQGWAWVDFEFSCPAGTSAIQPWLWINAYDNFGGGLVSYYELTDVTDQHYADAKVADEAVARAGADSALAGRTSTVEAQLRGDQDSTIAARIRDEAAARAGADSALAGRTSTVEAQLRGDQDSTIAARIRDEAAARAGADSALAGRTSTVEAQLRGDQDSTIAARIRDEAAARAGADSALAGRTSSLEVGFAKSQRGVLPTDFSGGDTDWNRSVVGGQSSWVYYEDTRPKSDWSKTDGMVVTGVHKPSGYLYLFARRDPIPVSAGDIVRLYASVGAYGGCHGRVYFDCRDRDGKTVPNSMNGGGSTPAGYLSDQVGNGAYATLAVEYVVPAGVSFVIPAFVSNANDYSGPLFVRWMRFEFANAAAVTSARLSTEEAARAGADSALAGRTSTVEAQLRGDQDSMIAARIRDEAAARAGADSALAGRTSTVEAQLRGDQDSTIAARIRDEAAARAGADSALAGRTSTVEAQLRGDQDSTIAARIRDEAAARAGADSALAGRTSTVEAQLARTPDVFHVRASGNSASKSPFGQTSGVFRPGDTGYIAVGRSYGVILFDSNSGVISAETFDVYGDLQRAQDMADVLMNVAPGRSVLVISCDEPANNRLARGLDAAMAYVGAGEDFYSPRFRSRSVYVLAGYGAAGRGRGVEFYKGDVDNDPNAFEDLMLPMLSGRWALGSNGGAQAVRAALTDEATARAGADSALAGRTSTVEAQLRGDQDSTIAARIRDEAAARAGADNALAGRTSTVEAQLRGDQDSTIAARIRDEAAARAGADSALAGRTSTVEAQLRGDQDSTIAARIRDEAAARAGADSALAGRTSTVEAQLRGDQDSTIAARIRDEAAARAGADSALAGRTSTVEAQLRGDQDSTIAARIRDEAAARAGADSALAGRTSSLEVGFAKSQRGVLPTDFSGGDTDWNRSVVGGQSSWVYYEDTRPKSDWSKTDGMVVTGVHKPSGYLYLFARRDPIPVSAGDIVRLYASVGAYGGCHGRVYFDCRDRDGKTVPNSMNSGGSTPAGYLSDQVGNGAYATLAVEYVVPAGVSFVIPAFVSNANDYSGPLFVRWMRFEFANAAAVTSARLSTEEAARAGADSALAGRTSTVEAQLRGDQDSTIAARIRDEAAARAGADSALASRTSTVEARAGDLEAKTGIIQTAVTDTTKKLESARLEFSAVTSGGRAALVLRSDKNAGAGVDLIGDLRVSGDVVVDGTFKPTKFDKSSMSREAQSSWSGSITPSVGQSETVPWSLGLGTIPPLGRFIWEFVAGITTNAGQQTTTTYNNRPLYTTYRDDGGLVVRATDNQGNQYNPRSQGTSMIVASTAFDATFIAFINRGNYDSGIVNEGDYYSRTLSATYTVTSIRLKATWVAI